MNKYRPERIELTCPLRVADQFESWLTKQLHKRAKLERTDSEDQSIISFWPTMSEYFYVLLLHEAKAKEFLSHVDKVERKA